MLVYIRESDKDKIMCNVDEKDIAEHLRVRFFVVLILCCILRCEFKELICFRCIQERLKREQEEKEHKKKEKAEAHLYTIIKVTV